MTDRPASIATLATSFALFVERYDRDVADATDQRRSMSAFGDLLGISETEIDALFLMAKGIEA